MMRLIGRCIVERVHMDAELITFVMFSLVVVFVYHGILNGIVLDFFMKTLVSF